MSLILDALRKSEAERRRGNLPALTLELPPSPPGAAASRAWWLAVPVALILAAIAFWMARPADRPPPAQPAVASPFEAVATEAATVAEPAAIRAPALPEPVTNAPVTTEPVETGPVPAASTHAPQPEAVAMPATEMPEALGTTTAPVLALADLTPGERRALPPLKLSMHMWSAAPADRFVILDGDRLGEGDRAGSAVVERIDPDGVILAADGRRIRLPLP